jgi:alkylation response protein AidB-like acyl-CoA dehydrogenase
MTSAAIRAWLSPVEAILGQARRGGWPRPETLTATLDEALAAYPVGADLPPGPERSTRLLMIRRHLARRGHVPTFEQPGLASVLAQFVCGYRDIDLRDATGLGHGMLIARHGSAAARQRWLPSLRAGELAGIAISEPHGGSHPADTRTYATAGPGGTWLVTGRKTWISRLCEAAVFIVLFRDPTGRMVAATIDAAEARLRRQPISQAGLAGWTWGTLDLNAVQVRPEDVLRGDGLVLLRRHFAAYRPLVTATALGGAAAVFDTVTGTLTIRHGMGEPPRLRDSALVTIGRAHARLVTALLGTAAAACIADAGHDNAELWGAAMKAHGVDTANHTTAELALLLGAAGHRADPRIAKTCRDLNGLLYADGIHDSLYLAAGKGHAAVDQARARIEAVRRLDAPARTSRQCSGGQPPARRRDDQPATTSPSSGHRQV